MAAAGFTWLETTRFVGLSVDLAGNTGKKRSAREHCLLAAAMRGASGEVEGDDGDVVVLAEAPGDLGDVTGGFVAHLLSAFEAEQFALGVGSLDDPIRKKNKPVAGFELEG